jgi:nucleoside-triphosphatase THEP1
MALAYVKTEARGETDRLLTALAARLMDRGARLGGVVQSNVACSDSDLCDMDVQVLPDGPSIRISQSLGRGARGCRLDPEALERAVGLVSRTLADGPDLLIVNKFGKHEADGRGFRPLIGEAMLAGIPVLTGVNATNEAAFLDFAERLAQQLPADLSRLVSWYDALAVADVPA